ncbi:hypothetical protein ABK54_004535 [Salmonella enterica subsp. enterica serovar Shubra]|nr:hypothetical protein [Salmonella enterica subsp. enterica serovar Shubra]
MLRLPEPHLHRDARMPECPNARLQMRHGLMEAASERKVTMPNWCCNRMRFSA